jgi:aspartate aminotransferase
MYSMIRSRNRQTISSKEEDQPRKFLHPQIIDLEESPTLRINKRCREMMAAGRHVYRLGLGQSPFPIPEEVVSALRLYAPRKEYQDVQGLFELRKAVAEFHRRKDQVDVMEENVLIGPGSKELLFLLQIAFNGQVIIPSPSWVSYLPQAKIIGNKIDVIHTRVEDNWRLMPEQLEEYLESQDRAMPHLLILNYPGNPDGQTYGSAHITDLARVARKYGLYILSDEIYGQLHHEGRHESIARHYPEGTIISSGLSKWCGAGGWRLGTFSFPSNLRWLLSAMSAIASETYTAVSAPIQYAAIEAFHCGSQIENYLAHARRILAQLGKKTAMILREGGVEVEDPVGGFYLFLDFNKYAERLKARGMSDSRILCEQLLQETGVAILPGVDFNRPEYEFSARLSYVDFDGAAALNASYAIPLHEVLPPDFSERYCPNVIEAAKRIGRFVSHAGPQNKSV